MKSLYCDLNGARIHYLEKGSGPTLILLPSLWLTSKSYEVFGQSLSTSFRVIIPDIYKGLSKFSHTAKSLEDYNDTLKEFTESLNISRFSLVGFSFSGPIAASFADKYPEQVNKLILVSTLPFAVNINHPLFRLAFGYLKLILHQSLSVEGIKTSYRWLTDTITYLVINPRQYIREPFIIAKSSSDKTDIIEVRSKLMFAQFDEFIPLKLLETVRDIQNLEITIVNKTHAWFFLEKHTFIKMVTEYIS